MRYADGSTRGYDPLVAFPPYVAAVALPRRCRPTTGASSRPSSTTRLVAGPDNVYAPGDAGDFPVKQAFLAFLQADAVADHIAADVTGARRSSTPFEPTSMCIMEMFDTATFAQVPRRAHRRPGRPVSVRPDADGDYRVGTSPVWRLGKKMLGLYRAHALHRRRAVPRRQGVAGAWRSASRRMSSMLAD